MRQGIAAIFNIQEPTVRLKSISNDSKMGINFNNNMVLPENFIEMVASNKRNLQEDE